MGRRKINIVKIENQRLKAITFNRRVQGLVKKAHELSVLCDTDVMVLLFDPKSRCHVYSSDDPAKLMERYEKAHTVSDQAGSTSAESGIARAQKGNFIQYSGADVDQFPGFEEAAAAATIDESPTSSSYPEKRRRLDSNELNLSRNSTNGSEDHFQGGIPFAMDHFPLDFQAAGYNVSLPLLQTTDSTKMYHSQQPAQFDTSGIMPSPATPYDSAQIMTGPVMLDMQKTMRQPPTSPQRTSHDPMVSPPIKSHRLLTSAAANYHQQQQHQRHETAAAPSSGIASDQFQGLHDSLHESFN